MRSIHWLFLVTAALFVFGIGLVVIGARTVRQAVPVPVERPMTTPVASMKQIMDGIVAPAADVVFNSVSTTVSFKGVEEVFPRNDDEWRTVGNSAAALAEAANLMMLDGRAVDRGDWLKMSIALSEASRLALKAVEAKDTAAILAAGETIYTSCNNCHQRYMRN